MEPLKKDIIKILHIEDSPEDAELTKNYLRDNSFLCEINLINNIKSFESEIIQFQPDIIISDFDIGDADGYDVLAIVKKISPGTPMIFLTGYLKEEQGVETLKAGASDYVFKGSMSRLISAILRALKDKKHESEKEKYLKMLKLSEKRYRTLLENLPAGIFRTSVDTGVIIKANTAAALMHGYKSAAELEGKYALDFYYDPADRENFLQEIKQRGRVKNKIIRLRKNTGDVVIASVTANLYVNKKGEPQWVEGVIEDVTESVEAEKKIKETAEFLRTLLMTMPSPIFYKDRDGRYAGCNKRFAELILGIPAEDIIGKTVFDFPDIIPGDLAEIYHSSDMELLRNPGHQSYEARVKCADGVDRHYLFNKATYCNEENEPAGIVGVMVDITERVTMESEMKIMNEEMELFFTSTSSIIIGVSVKDRITHWNSAAEEVFKIRVDDVKGKQFPDCGIKWDWEFVYEGIGRSIINEKSIRIDELRFEKGDGTYGVLGVNINPLKRGGDVLQGFIIIGKDITEQKIIEGQALQSNKLEAIGQLAAGVAHEINSPLQYIGDNVKFIDRALKNFIQVMQVFLQSGNEINNSDACFELLKRGIRLAEENKIPYFIEETPDAVSQSLDGIERVSKIVQSMKAFSHPGAGTKVPADINRAIENTINISRNEWKYDAEINYNPDLTISDVPCIESEFNQVILNLIVNAADAVRDAKGKGLIDKGEIVISTKKEDDYAVIKVQDNGAGIPAGVRNRIFDPFFTTKEVGKGTGQGLPISHSIIAEKHGGVIYFETEEGKGTSFFIKLPLREED